MTADKSLMEALLAARANFPVLPKDKTNPHFKNRYTSLDALVEAIQPVLRDHGLVWSTLPCFGPGGEPALRYQLTHASTGETLSGEMPLMLVKQDPQGFGSALTYARRYSITAVLDLTADEDDDGTAGSRKPQQQAKPPKPAGNGKPAGLPQSIIDELVSAKKEAAAPDEWIRSQLVALGVDDVPEGPLTLGTIKRLTEAQASDLLEVFGQVIAARSPS